VMTDDGTCNRCPTRHVACVGYGAEIPHWTKHKDFIQKVRMFLGQEKDSIEDYQRALSGQSSPASPTRGFEGFFTELIGVEATPSMTGFPTSNFVSTPPSSAPSTHDSEQGSASHALQTFIPQQGVSLQGSNDVSSPPEYSLDEKYTLSPEDLTFYPVETLAGQGIIDPSPPWTYYQEDPHCIYCPQPMPIGEPAPPFLGQSVAYSNGQK